MSKKSRAHWLTYQEPCPRCGDRLRAVYAVVEEDVYMQCDDCGIGFSSPAAIESDEGEVFQDRVRRGKARPATRDEVLAAGSKVDNFRLG